MNTVYVNYKLKHKKKIKIIFLIIFMYIFVEIIKYFKLSIHTHTAFTSTHFKLMDAFCCTNDCKDQIIKNRGSDKQWYYIIVALFPLDAGVKVRLNKKSRYRLLN